MPLIYIVEDDENIREIESLAMSSCGYEVRSFADAAALYQGLEEKNPDLLLLDVMLPDEDGNEIVQRLRRRKATRELPVIMVTAKTNEYDMIRGLEDGADDYIKKPFSIAELVTRVRVLLRRTTPAADDLLCLEEIRMDLDRHVVTVNDEKLELTFKEYELLKLFLEKQGSTLSRELIMQKVWDTSFEGESRTLDMHIKTLRQKLGESGRRIRTVRNVGYIME